MRNTLRTIFAVFACSARKRLLTPRALLAALCALAFVETFGAAAVREACVAFDETVPVLGLFTALIASPLPVCLLYGCWLMLICDAPFIDEEQPYLLLRSGRYAWSVGQILYIFFAALVFWLWIALATVLLSLSNAHFGDEWGRLYTSVARGLQAGSYFPPISSDVIARYTPGEAFFLLFGLQYSVTVLFALSVYAVNLLSKRHYGVLIPAAFLLIHWIFYFWFPPVYLIRFSLLTLTMLDIFDPIGVSRYPSARYTIGLLATSLGVLVVTCVGAMYRRAIYTQPPL